MNKVEAFEDTDVFLCGNMIEVEASTEAGVVDRLSGVLGRHRHQFRHDSKLFDLSHVSDVALHDRIKGAIIDAIHSKISNDGFYIWCIHQIYSIVYSCSKLNGGNSNETFNLRSKCNRFAREFGGG